MSTTFLTESPPPITRRHTLEREDGGAGEPRAGGTGGAVQAVPEVEAR